MTTALGTLSTAIATPVGCQSEGPVSVLIRPDDIHFNEAGEYTAEITGRSFRGANYLYNLQLDDGSHLLALAPSHQQYSSGSRVNFSLDLQHLVMLKQEW
ncbi:MAG: hypothetical protein CSA79_06320 [Thiothrix nivea]|nr:MAG: hypothetical protein CSA79_06320 [Thiothrix nivea]